MSDAFKCDRCGEYGDEPAIKTETHVISGNYVAEGDHPDELCESCAEDYVAFWQEGPGDE